MVTMKRLTSILFILSLALIVVAQNSVESKEILDKTYAGYMASDGINLSFTSSMGQAGDTNLYPQTGEAFIKGDKFRLEMDEMTVWFDGTTQWVLLKEVEEVNISNPTDSELASISPLALLKIYTDGYTLNAPVSNTVNNQNVYSINMLAVSANNDIKEISVAIDKTTNRLVQVILTTTNNLITKINITNYNDNFKFNDTEFTFNRSDYPGVEIIDLR